MHVRGLLLYGVFSPGFSVCHDGSELRLHNIQHINEDKVFGKVEINFANMYGNTEYIQWFSE